MCLTLKDVCLIEKPLYPLEFVLIFLGHPVIYLCLVLMDLFYSPNLVKIERKIFK